MEARAMKPKITLRTIGSRRDRRLAIWICADSEDACYAEVAGVKVRSVTRGFLSYPQTIVPARPTRWAPGWAMYLEFEK